MTELIEKALILIRALEKPSRKQPVYFTIKEHTFMTEGTHIYALCYNQKTMKMVFVKCVTHGDNLRLIDTNKQIPTDKLMNYTAYLSQAKDIGKRFFKLKDA